MDRSEALDRLHGSLARRETPETVAGWILEALPPEADHGLCETLAKVTRKSSRSYWGWSSMGTDFRQPAEMTRQLDKASELADLFLGKDVAADADDLESFVEDFSRLIGREPGQGDFLKGRLNSEVRERLLPGLSGRRYNKLFRLAGRLEDRLARLRREQGKYRLTLTSKAGLVPELTRGQVDHLPTAAFVAYYSARTKLRSEFTISGQQRPFDEAAEALLRLCEADPDTRWSAVAHAFPRADVLARLTDEEKGALLGKSFAILDEVACLLQDVYQRTDVNVATMIVKRGNDSSSWNLLAGAWNKARDSWIALAEALGMDELLDAVMPGKVLTLMAGDVASWHGSAGNGLHPDTRVWAELPKPWDVISGSASCTRAEVEAACRRNGVDPVKSGWSRARARTQVAEFRPTPELVHGVTVSNPYLADVLRRMGAFSGKELKIPATLAS